jgi:hypothetical protein
MGNEKLRQIIEDIAEIYNKRDKPMTFDDFYEVIVGVYGKECRALSYKESSEHKRDLLENGIYTRFFHDSDSFLLYEHNLRAGRHLRFYMNAHDAGSAREIAKSIRRFMGDRGYQLKLVNKDQYGYSRFDNMVFYLHLNDDIKRAAEFLQSLPLGYFEEGVPLHTKKIAKGIGYATSVKAYRHVILGEAYNHDRCSFNCLHSIVLKRTFDTAIEKEIEDTDEITLLYRQALIDAGFDPENTHLNGGIEDPLKGLKVVSE